MNISAIIPFICIYFIPVLFAITLHEVAHGWVARYFGDQTAAAQGRLTLNPFAHVDPIGTIIMPLVLFVLTNGSFVFGYAKPVPVNFGRLRNPRRDMIWVSLAGPMVNFIQAIFWTLLLTIMVLCGVREGFFLSIASAGIGVNLVLWALNLFPLPPLDGGRVLVGLLPYKAARTVASIEPYGFFIVMALLVPGLLTRCWLKPLTHVGWSILFWLPMQFFGISG